MALRRAQAPASEIGSETAQTQTSVGRFETWPARGAAVRGISPSGEETVDGELLRRTASIRPSRYFCQRRQRQRRPDVAGHAEPQPVRLGRPAHRPRPAHLADTHYLRIYVAHLREKLGDDPSRPRCIVTEPGIGYRLLAE